MDDQPQFQASVKPRKGKVGKPIHVTITATNPGPSMAFVSDPRPGGGTLMMELTPPGGPMQSVPMGALVGGARPQLVNLQVLPGKSADIDFDLGTYAPLATAGAYDLVLVYTWKPGHVWRSPALSFALDP